MGLSGLLLALISGAVAFGCENTGDDGATASAGASGEGGEGAGAIGEGGNPSAPEGGRSGGGSHGIVGGSAADAGQGGAQQGGFTAQDGGMAGTPSEAGGGAGGDGSTDCIHNGHLGTRRISVRYEERLCIFHSDDPEVVPPGCGEPEVIDEGTVTFSIFKTRDQSWHTAALLDGAGVTIGPDGTTNPEWWIGPILSDGLSNPGFPISEGDGACSSLPSYTFGEAYFKVDSSTGRVSEFERVCRDEYRTLYYEYRLIGSDVEGCDVVACNDLVNTAPPAQINRTRPTVPSQAEPLDGGEAEVTSGTYHLEAVDYPSDPTCTPVAEERPSPISETLVVTASSPTAGIMSWVSERSTSAPTRSTFSYEVITGSEGFPVLKTKYICGDEVLSSNSYGSWYPDAGEAYFNASADELRLEIPTDWCSDGVSSGVYIYGKQ